jgi:hypothetical protein
MAGETSLQATKRPLVGDYCCVWGCKNNRGCDKSQGISRKYYKFPVERSVEEARRRQLWVKWVICGRGS